MLYQIETTTGMMSIAGLMYLNIEDIHGNKLREGDTVRAMEFYNREKEIVEELGGEYWTKDGKPGKDHMMGYELCTKEQLKGHMILEYEGVIKYDDGCFCVFVTRCIYNSPKQAPYEVGDGIPLGESTTGKYVHPLFDFEIIKRQEL